MLDRSRSASTGAQPRRWPTAALGIALLGLAGCFQVDATVNADGSGTMTLTYQRAPNATPQSETPNLTSPTVKVSSITVQGESMVAKLDFTDVTKLDSTEAFRNVRIRRDRVGDAERLRIVLRVPKPDPYSASHDEGTVTLTLPGPVRFANRDAQKSGNRVTWRLAVGEIARHRSTKLTAEYNAAG